MRTIRFALRTLFRTPFVTGVAIISLALGIGANAAIFSLFEQMLLRPLPVSKPGELVNLANPGPKPGSQSCGQAGDCDEVFSYMMFRDLEKAQTAFTGIAAHVGFGSNLAYKGETLSGEGVLVSGSYFPLLGIQPAIGRLLGPGDDAKVGEGHVVVLSHEYWRSRFGSDVNVLNAVMTINGQQMAIVGVAPERFYGTTLGNRPQVFVPITMRGLMQPPFKGFDNRRSYWAYLFARLKPGETIASATSSLNGQYHTIVNNVEAPLQLGMSEQTMARFRAKEVTIKPGQLGQSSLHSESRTPLLILMAVTGVVLIIACANIANLLLARSASRAAEMAVRLSIGASRSQLVRQLLVESCLLALMGGAAGLLVARWTLGVIGSLLPADAASFLVFEIEPAVLLFAAALALGTGVLFGLFPALHSTRPDLASVLKGVSGQPGGSKSAAWFRKSLVTVQIMLSTLLLVCAGLFAKSLVNVTRVDLGVKIDHVVTFEISPRMNGYPPAQSLELFKRVETELAGIPGAISVTASLVPVLAGSNWGTDVDVQGFPKGPDVDNNSRYNEIGPGFFRTLGVPLMSGREFTDSDVLGTRKVAIVNETFAKKFGLGRDAVGKLMTSNTGPKSTLDTEIVGLVQDAKYSDVKDPIPPVFYSPYRQDDSLGDINFYVRTGLDPEVFLKSIPPVMKRIDPNLPIEDLQTLAAEVRQNTFLDRFISSMSVGFAVLATVLASVGLYGVLAYTVTQRTREFGLRMALGADPGNVRGLVMKQVIWMTIIGGTIGAGLAVVVGYIAEREEMLYKLKGWDPVVLTTSIVLLTIVALGAGFFPAMRAAKTDPMRALRYE
jgi:predicted permease